MELKKHQKECINKIENHFKNENKGLIKMFCGSGKSFIIYHTLLQYTNSISILVVPSINLITQFNRDYLLNDSLKNYNKKYFNKNYELMTICSKNELNNKNLNFTTNENDIIEFLHKKNIKIILITYQSLTNLINIIKINNIIIDLLCFDEAHHILGNNTSKLLYKNNNFINKLINKTLYFTATPKNTKEYKMYDPNSKINNNICGPLIYEYSHINGVNDNILNDFNIRIELYDDNTDINIYKSICRTILETGNNRVLTFHSRSFIKSDKSSDVLSFTNEFNKDELIKCFNDILYNEFSHLKDVPGRANQKALASMFCSVTKANNLRKEYEESNNVKYDIVIRSRIDHTYHKPVDVRAFFKETDKDCVYVPHNHQYMRDYHYLTANSGLSYASMSETFIFANPENMDKVCGVFPNFEKIYEDIYPENFAEQYIGYQVRGVHKLKVVSVDAPYDIYRGI